MNTLALETELPAEKQTKANIPARLSSIDAYRGLVMFLMMAEVLSLGKVAQARPGSGLCRRPLSVEQRQFHVPTAGDAR